MKRQLIYTALLLGSTAGFTLAQQAKKPAQSIQEATRGIAPAPVEVKGAEKERAAAEKALQRYYGNIAKIRMVGNHTVNGVSVFTAEVTNAGGSSMASVTGNGDLLETGVPSSGNSLTPGAREITQGLFQSPSNDIDTIETHYFYAHVKAGGKTFVVKLDATGTILDIKSPTQMREDAFQNAQPAGGADKAAIEKLVMQHFPTVTINDVRTAIHDPGYYEGFFKDKNGNPGFIILNVQGQVSMFRTNRPRNELPVPVQTALATVLKSDQIQNVGSGTDWLYRVVQHAGNEQFTLRVHTNGDVEDIGETGAAATAAAARVPKR